MGSEMCIRDSIGVTPNTEILKGSKLYFKNGIKVNEYFETEIKDIYAIGDIAFAKNMFLDKHIREESWNNAEKQSLILAQNLYPKPIFST